ncbi:MAG: hypothetical protein PHE88_04375 [Elusimicrobia bacterium]|nr:hypothetical protein [Elusimicrobiota bacterium]
MISLELADHWISLIDNKKFHICYFADSTHQPNSPPHYNIFIPITDNTCLLVCFITSKVEKRKKYYDKSSSIGQKAINSLVYIGKKDFNCLKQDSIIDCNQVVRLTREELKNRIRDKSEFKIIRDAISKKIQKEIIGAVRNSPVVDSYIKSILIED